MGKIAGLGGLSLGVLLLLYRPFIKKATFPDPPELGYRLLRLFLILTFSIAAIGIGAWVYLSVTHAEPAPGHLTSWDADPSTWPYAETKSLAVNQVVVFHGLSFVVNLITRDNGGTAHVVADLNGKPFSGFYHQKDELRIADDHCEFVVSLLVIRPDNFLVGDEVDVEFRGNCKA